jgi:hypothetical protein
MHDEKRGDVGFQDPKLGDHLLIDDERYHILERCSCGGDADHIRWFLEGRSEMGPIAITQAATLAKEWDEDGAIWWWFGRRIAASDLRVQDDRLSNWLGNHVDEVPDVVAYEGKRCRLAGESEPPRAAAPDDDAIPLTLWEYVDDDDIDSVLVEQSSEGDVAIYHGAYYDPADLRLA